jgi:hypothetical protein
LFLVVLPIASFAQNQEETGYILFPKCNKLSNDDLKECNSYELKKFIAHHVEYPQVALDGEFEGKVFVQYKLTAKETLEEILIKKDGQVHPSLNDAAMKVVQKLKDSIDSGVFQVVPMKVKGRPMSSFYKIPIHFVLPSDERQKRKDIGKIVIATYRTSEKTVQFRRDLEGNIYAYLLLPAEEKMLIKISGEKDPITLTPEEQSYFFLYNLTFLKPEILLTLGEVDGKKYELFIDKNREEKDSTTTDKSSMCIKVYSVENPNIPIEVFTHVDQLFSSKYSVLLFR